MCSREGLLGSHPTTPRFLPKAFAARWQLLRNAPSKGYHSGYITLFFKGTSGFYALMKVSLAGLTDFCEVILGKFKPFFLVLLA